ncbi:hypothetical protein [Cohnella lubricantis]|uniref:Uncharacterized protein n=1 Tax=Cohnella lubricantis TaxID=2163172 RepID=A0A841THN0_9BACL|nr:hypothetical protein [Cohnella lubricantis]MBB6678457.1 hypothetical protein [Cohnella lubricantis]MBP2116837.1 hypothetical protein [Cohnella lubricantis]
MEQFHCHFNVSSFMNKTIYVATLMERASQERSGAKAQARTCACGEAAGQALPGAIPRVSPLEHPLQREADQVKMRQFDSFLKKKVLSLSRA